MQKMNKASTSKSVLLQNYFSWDSSSFCLVEFWELLVRHQTDALSLIEHVWLSASWFGAAVREMQNEDANELKHKQSIT